ncbi:MAG TPA: GtrA family protein [Ktedonobacterales bacterium]
MTERMLQEEHTQRAEAHARGELEQLMTGNSGSMAAVARTEPSFVLTGVALVDSLFATADRITNGKAGMLQRVTTYLIIGGFAAVVNLVVLYLLDSKIPLPVAANARWWVAQVAATEISILANFIPNDHFTFSRLPGHARSWWARCLRFHSTCIVGSLLTIAISSALHYGLHFVTLIAQAIAILIALVFNFTFHHLWTYRHVEAG